MAGLTHPDNSPRSERSSRSIAEGSADSLKKPLLSEEDREESSKSNHSLISTPKASSSRASQNSGHSKATRLSANSSAARRNLRQRIFKSKFREKIREIKNSPRYELTIEIAAYTSRNFLRSLVTQSRRFLIGLVGSRIDDDANSTAKDYLDPLYTIAAVIPGTLKRDVANDYKEGLRKKEAKYQQKAFALYRFTMVLSFPVTLLAVLTISAMPQALNSDSLKRMGPAFPIFALSSLVTVINASSTALTDALSDKRKTGNLIRALIPEIFIIGGALLGLRFESFLLIALVQLLVSAIGSIFTSRNIHNGLEEMGCKDTQPLPREEKIRCGKVMAQGLPGAVMDSVNRILFVSFLQAKPNSQAAVDAFFTISQLYFVPYVLFKPISSGMSYFITQARSKESRRFSERLIVGAATATSVSLALGLLAAKDSIIPLLSPPNNDNAIQANKITSNFSIYLLTMIGLLLEGPAVAFGEKIINVHEQRLLAGAIDFVPSLLAIILSLPKVMDLSPEMMLTAIIISWIVGSVGTIAVGALLPEPFTDQPQPASSRPNQAALLLSADMTQEQQDQAFQQLEMSEPHSARSRQSASAPRMADPVRQMTQTMNGHRGSELEEKPYRSHRSSNGPLLDDAEQGVA